MLKTRLERLMKCACDRIKSDGDLCFVIVTPFSAHIAARDRDNERDKSIVIPVIGIIGTGTRFCILLLSTVLGAIV